MLYVCQELEALARADALTSARGLLDCLEHEFGRVASALDVAVPRR
jgi:hypothetical protein